MIGRDRFSNRPKFVPKTPAEGATQPPGKAVPQSNEPTTVTVKCTCGHNEHITFPPIANEKDRQKKADMVAAKACRMCRKVAHEEREKKQKAEAGERKGAKRGRWANSKLFRLPAGSWFSTAPFLAEPEPLWTVTLHVPTGTGTFEVFISDGRAIHQCIEKAGRAWLKWSEEQKPTTTDCPDKA